MNLRNLSVDELNRAARICERIHYTISNEPIANHFYVVLRQALPGVHFSINHFSVAPVVVAGNMISESVSNETLSLFGRFMHEHPGVAKIGLVHSAETGQLLSELKREHYRRTHLYNEVFKPIDIEDQIWMGIGDREERFGIVYSRDSVYTDSDVGMAEIINPHVQIAWKNWKQTRHLEQRFALLNEKAVQSEEQARIRISAKSALDVLSRRQRQVVELLASGKTNREIGDVLKISPRTVGKHLEQIYAAVGTHTRTALIAAWNKG